MSVKLMTNLDSLACKFLVSLLLSVTWVQGLANSSILYVDSIYPLVTISPCTSVLQNASKDYFISLSNMDPKYGDLITRQTKEQDLTLVTVIYFDSIENFCDPSKWFLVPNAQSLAGMKSPDVNTSILLTVSTNEGEIPHEIIVSFRMVDKWIPFLGIPFGQDISALNCPNGGFIYKLTATFEKQTSDLMVIRAHCTGGETLQSGSDNGITSVLRDCDYPVSERVIRGMEISQNSKYSIVGARVHCVQDLNISSLDWVGQLPKSSGSLKDLLVCQEPDTVANGVIIARLDGADNRITGLSLNCSKVPFKITLNEKKILKPILDANGKLKSIALDGEIVNIDTGLGTSQRLTLTIDVDSGRIQVLIGAEWQDLGKRSVPYKELLDHRLRIQFDTNRDKVSFLKISVNVSSIYGSFWSGMRIFQVEAADANIGLGSSLPLVIISVFLLVLGISAVLIHFYKKREFKSLKYKGGAGVSANPLQSFGSNSVIARTNSGSNSKVATTVTTEPLPTNLGSIISQASKATPLIGSKLPSVETISKQSQQSSISINIESKKQEPKSSSTTHDAPLTKLPKPEKVTPPSKVKKPGSKKNSNALKLNPKLPGWAKQTTEETKSTVNASSGLMLSQRSNNNSSILKKIGEKDDVIVQKSDNIASSSLIRNAMKASNSDGPNMLPASPLSRIFENAAANGKSVTVSLTTTMTSSGLKFLSVPGYLKLDPEKDYDLGDRIGSGVSGIVYKAKLKKPIQEIDNVAVKIVPDPDAALFKFEIALMGCMPPSPYIVKFLGYVEYPNGIIMKLYSGSLKDYIFDRNVSINTSDTYKIALDIARGGAHIHSFDIVHFDIKPLNILVDYDSNKGGFNCCISDFGGAKAIGTSLDDYNERLVKGLKLPEKAGITLAYCCPEILERFESQSYRCEEIHKRADVYSFSITIYETLVRSKAWKSFPIDTLQSVIIDGVRPELPNYLAGSSNEKIRRLVSLIPQGWAQDPEQRPRFETICQYLS